MPIHDRFPIYPRINGNDGRCIEQKFKVDANELFCVTSIPANIVQGKGGGILRNFTKVTAYPNWASSNRYTLLFMNDTAIEVILWQHGSA